MTDVMNVVCSEVRECLKLDADHKSCHDHYKKVKKLVQQMKAINDLINVQQWTDCINKVDQMLKVESGVDAYLHKANGLLCHCHTQVMRSCCISWQILTANSQPFFL
jgi:DnaJ homolog subfamily C member 3